jgi:polyisoprenoid-binding protein YceI
MQITQDQLAVPRLGCYEIDTSASRVTFKTRHMFGLGPVTGSFTIRGGTVDITEPLTGSAIHAEIDASAFETGNRGRDTTVRSARLLDVAKYPAITFQSDRIDDTTVTGALTVGKVTRIVRLQIEALAVAGASFAARGTVRIDRTDFGLTAMRGLAGRHLDLTVEVQCVRI